jgi:predicted RNase H-like HicB family nuclease
MKLPGLGCSQTGMIKLKTERDMRPKEKHMKTEMNMIYWKSGKSWLGKLKEHPEIMTQGRTLKELEENIRDAYRMMVMEDVPTKYQEKAIAI